MWGGVPLVPITPPRVSLPTGRPLGGTQGHGQTDRQTDGHTDTDGHTASEPPHVAGAWLRASRAMGERGGKSRVGCCWCCCCWCWGWCWGCSWGLRHGGEGKDPPQAAGAAAWRMLPDRKPRQKLAVRLAARPAAGDGSPGHGPVAKFGVRSLPGCGGHGGGGGGGDVGWGSCSAGCRLWMVLGWFSLLGYSCLSAQSEDFPCKPSRVGAPFQLCRPPKSAMSSATPTSRAHGPKTMPELWVLGWISYKRRQRCLLEAHVLCKKHRALCSSGYFTSRLLMNYLDVCVLVV